MNPQNESNPDTRPVPVQPQPPQPQYAPPQPQQPQYAPPQQQQQSVAVQQPTLQAQQPISQPIPAQQQPISQPLPVQQPASQPLPVQQQSVQQQPVSQQQPQFGPQSQQVAPEFVAQQPDYSQISQEPQAVSQKPKRMSRRSILRGAAGVGAIGVAAAVGGGAAIAIDRRMNDPAPASKPVAMAAMPENAMAGPIVIYLRDTTTGEIDVFGGTGQTRLHDPGLAGQILQAMK